ncbi:twin-arginine translocase TatA/TatE family subunit [Megasphaera sp.]
MALGKSLREFKEAVNTADVKADEKNNDEKINAGRRWQVAGRK